MTARLIRLSLGSGRGPTEQAIDRHEPFVPDVGAVLVHVQLDMRSADVFGELVGERADVIAARLRMRERMLDRGADGCLSRVGDLRLEVGAREDPRERDGKTGLALPPLTEVRDRNEPMLGVGEAALVD